MKRTGIIVASMLMLLAAASANAAETEIGKAVAKNGMEIGAVYLQPVIMAPMMPGMDGSYDVHLEADIHAQKGNKNGFGPGDWIPYLGVTYRLEKLGSDWKTFGAFMPMVANDGPHYGANVKLDGPGKYRLTYRIMPPPYQGFYRHTDKETGVDEWWSPFSVTWEFPFVGVGKKGTY
ncbi:MAG: iron transporter [Alphaproteobacteria bacterium]|nr:iron transporter [Alphaproteobacteria bacterium]